MHYAKKCALLLGVAVAAISLLNAWKASPGKGQPQGRASRRPEAVTHPDPVPPDTRAESCASGVDLRADHIRPPAEASNDPERLREWILQLPLEKLRLIAGTASLDRVVSSVLSELCRRGARSRSTVELEDFLRDLNARLRSAGSTVDCNGMNH